MGVLVPALPWMLEGEVEARVVGFRLTTESDSTSLLEAPCLLVPLHCLSDRVPVDCVLG